MTVRVYALTNAGVALTDVTGATLDAVSLQLPEGAYTTLRTYDGPRILGLSAHLQRLTDSLALLHGARSFDPAATRAALRTVIERERLPAARLRFTAPYDDDRVFISIEPFESYPPECYTQGVRCGTTRRLARDTPRAKRSEFIKPSRSVKAQHDSDVQEVLLVNAEGCILEGLSSSFFTVLDGALRTAGEGVLEGVTRGVVLALAIELLPVVCTAIHLADLPRVVEAFITSSSREVMPVVQIDQTTIGSGAPGSITQMLMARYRAHVMQAAELP